MRMSSLPAGNSVDPVAASARSVCRGAAKVGEIGQGFVQGVKPALLFLRFPDAQEWFLREWERR